MKKLNKIRVAICTTALAMVGSLALAFSSCGCEPAAPPAPAPHIHKWGSAVVKKEATCLPGEEEYTCKTCGEKETRTVAALGDKGHDWQNSGYTPACEANGELTYKCTYCKDTKQETIPLEGHMWENDRCLACGQTASVGLEYRLSDDGMSYILVGVGNCRDSKIYVPSVHNDKEVKAVDGAFNGYDWVERLEIIGGVETVDDRAGSNCKKLAWVVFSDSVSTIGEYAFAENDALKTITWGDGVNLIGEGAFYDCNALTTVTFSDSIEYIGKYAFYNCDKLSEVVVPSSVKRINSFAFADSLSLNKLTLNEGLQCISESAFANCDSLGEVVIPNSVTEIGKNAFSDCGKLEALKIGDGVTTINEGAFSNNSKLKKVEMPAALTFVGADAFSKNSSLEKVIIDDVAAWCNISFENANANPLANGSYSTVLYVGEAEKTWVSISETTSIAQYAFYGYKKMNKLTISKEVASIGNEAFAGCTGISEIQFNAAACEIGENVFNNAGSNASIVFGSDVQYVPYGLFKTTEEGATASIASVSFDEKSVCTEICGYAFEDCEKLNNVQISDTVKRIGYRAFAGCDSIYTLNANTYAFAHLNTSKVSSLTVASGDIEAGAFEGAQALKTLKLSAGVTSVGKKAFASCGGLESVEMAKQTDAFVEIHKGAFAFATNLKSFDLPKANIGALAFYSCVSLTNASLGGGDVDVTVGDYAFAACSKLNTAKIKDDVVKIGANAFKGTVLENVDFEDRMNWYVEGEEEALWTTYLAEPDVAAQFLAKKYYDRAWTFVPAEDK